MLQGSNINALEWTLLLSARLRSSFTQTMCSKLLQLLVNVIIITLREKSPTQKLFYRQTGPHSDHSGKACFVVHFKEVLVDFLYTLPKKREISDFSRKIAFHTLYCQGSSSKGNSASKEMEAGGIL